MFYAIELKEDGHWHLIYNNYNAEGVDGNEEFYRNPSGMLSANIAKF